MWKKYINKKNRDSCLPYVNSNGIVVVKLPIPLGFHQCKFDCKNFIEEDRLHICKSFWGLSSYERKKDFILQNIAENPTVQRTPRNENAAPRKSARSYYFRKAHSVIFLENHTHFKQAGYTSLQW